MGPSIAGRPPRAVYFSSPRSLPGSGRYELLAKREDLEGLRAQAAAEDGHAATQLARLLAEGGDLDEVIQMTRAWHDTWSPAKLLAKSGDLEGLRIRADVGDRNAGWWLAKQLADLATWTNCVRGACGRVQVLPPGEAGGGCGGAAAC
jgi:hypothetical protein